MEYPTENYDFQAAMKPGRVLGVGYVGNDTANALSQGAEERTLFEGAANRLARLQSVIEDTGGALENVNNRVLGAVPTNSAGQAPVRAGAPTALGDALLANLDDLINIAVRVREDAYRLNRSL